MAHSDDTAYAVPLRSGGYRFEIHDGRSCGMLTIEPNPFDKGTWRIWSRSTDPEAPAVRRIVSADEAREHIVATAGSLALSFGVGGGRQ
jgi:hypothetical protein